MTKNICRTLFEDRRKYNKDIHLRLLNVYVNFGCQVFLLLKGRECNQECICLSWNFETMEMTEMTETTQGINSLLLFYV